MCSSIGHERDFVRDDNGAAIRDFSTFLASLNENNELTEDKLLARFQSTCLPKRVRSSIVVFAARLVIVNILTSKPVIQAEMRKKKIEL